MKRMTMHGTVTAVTLSDDTVVLVCQDNELNMQDWSAAVKHHGVADNEPADWDFMQDGNMMVWEIRP